MTSVKAAAVIRRRKEQVYRVLREMDRFPSFLRDVKEISVKQSDSNRVISDWKIDIEGTPVEWRQETVFDEATQDTITFRMLEGDYERFEGKWELEKVSDDVTRVKLQAQFQWGVPGLERYVSNVLEEKASDSMKGMLFSIRRELHKT
jgi:ribosome-associated toxin RatA of RatAB toxin-antitoxin module